MRCLSAGVGARCYYAPGRRTPQRRRQSVDGKMLGDFLPGAYGLPPGAAPPPLLGVVPDVSLLAPPAAGAGSGYGKQRLALRRDRRASWPHLPFGGSAGRSGAADADDDHEGSMDASPSSSDDSSGASDELGADASTATLVEDARALRLTGSDCGGGASGGCGGSDAGGPVAGLTAGAAPGFGYVSGCETAVEATCVLNDTGCISQASEGFAALFGVRLVGQARVGASTSGRRDALTPAGHVCLGTGGRRIR